MGLQGVILDIDGTLVLSNDAHAQAWVEAFATYGYEVPFEKIRPLIGMGGDKIIPMMVPELNKYEGDGKAISHKRKELMINSFVPTLSPTPGARQLLLQIKQAGLKTIVASSATSEELSLLFKAAQVDDLLNADTMSVDADASKPAPDIVEGALNQLKMQPNQVVMIGDTPYDVEAARKCGVGAIAVRCGGFDDSQLKDAIAIYDDPADLLAHYTDSPLG
ncbi:MAG: HAD family hydrolase [Aphanothece sp. CMT-3BRIN-NPC111]|jgi:HAD superfamily hydrolase (TIGR01509 family)|nr:HAD family hydrolase [Aphanothece sp. CMT-3BRIN-NPC111]